MEILARHRRFKWTSLVVVALLLIWMFWPDRRLAEVKAMQQELFGKDAKKLSPEERKGKWEELRKATENLSPSQKQELAKEGQDRFQKELERYAKLSKKEQNEYLDKKIDGMKKAPKGPSSNLKSAQAGAGFAQKSGKTMSSEERDRMKRQRLDRSTPEFRVLMANYRKDLQNRMNARGLQAPTWMAGPR